MPIGRVKWFDQEKGFGFVTSDEGDMFLHQSALPDGVKVAPGTRLEFDVVDGRRGKQVLKARLVDGSKRNRDPKKSADMIDDVITLLEDTSAGLRQGRFPDPVFSNKVAEVLRHIADDLEG